MLKTILSLVAPVTITSHLRNILVGSINKSIWLSKFFKVKSSKSKKFTLTDEQVQLYTKSFNRLLVFYTFVTLLLFTYFVNLLLLKRYASSIVACSLFIFSMVNVFRYHFWLFQLANKKVCSLKQWWVGNAD